MEPSAPSNFVADLIAEDNLSGRFGGRVHTRFPPEPNGYLHIGHAKAICIDFGMAARFGGKCNLRMDDTNPCTEDVEYVDSIQADVRWLGFDWADRFYYASDFFPQMHDYAVQLIRQGDAYVCDLTAEEVRAGRGTLTEPGQESPWRQRGVAENLDLFARMRAGEFSDGARTLRAKIDMGHPNLLLRDPVMYRILHATHHRTGDAWCIYPMYDWAHGLEDSLEGVTHSICTLEFEIHRPLYDWFLDRLGIHHPRQIEFARLNLGYTVMSKRKLLQLVRDGRVNGWDDPRMPTLCGLRRRGFPPAAIRHFCDLVGVTKFNSLTDMALLEHCVREELNASAPRAMAVLNPLKVVIETYPEDQVEELEAVNNPEDPAAGSRRVPFCRELWIERDDFMEHPPAKFFRLAPGREVRLRYGYLVTCREAVRGPDGEICELRCIHDPATRGGNAPDGRKVKATIHWVSARHAVDAEVRLYDRLLSVADPGAESPDADFRDFLNPGSLSVVPGAKAEPMLADAKPGERWQFERLGYFCADPDTRPGKPVFNRVVPLKDTWAKVAART